MATKFGGKDPWPECNALLGSKDMHGSAKVNQRSNSLEVPCGHRILVERTPDQSVMHWWGQRSCKGQLGKIAYKCVRPSNEANAAEHYAAAGALVLLKYQSLCMCVCICMSGYAFPHASTYRAETWHGGRGRAHEVCGHIFEGTPPWVKGHPGVNLP